MVIVNGVLEIEKIATTTKGSLRAPTDVMRLE